MVPQKLDNCTVQATVNCQDIQNLLPRVTYKNTDEQMDIVPATRSRDIEGGVVLHFLKTSTKIIQNADV